MYDIMQGKIVHAKTRPRYEKGILTTHKAMIKILSHIIYKRRTVRVKKQNENQVECLLYQRRYPRCVYDEITVV